ncbi:MAG: hypothetical protein LBT27_07540 [Prevotellaceae bacterium]|jgi:hypothetical protein|nr:hypothetical protein [Prevotellaceae bacterium]
MIEIATKIHDKLSIEFKVGFVVRRKLKVNNFAINTWIFIPNSLDINNLTYSKSQFYRDVKSNIRLITPVFLLKEIALSSAIPLHNLEKTFHSTASDPTRTNIREYEYQIKMFSAIFKSAMRNEVAHLLNNTIEEDIGYLINSYLESVSSITDKYRDLRRIINVSTISPEVLDYYFFGDEFISNIVEQSACRIINFLEQRNKEKYGKFICNLRIFYHKELNYKKEKGYTMIDKDSPTENREFVFRRGLLKKYVESDLFLQARKKKDGVLVEQIYYSIAAGLSMIFATAIAFSVQMKYGNFTIPLFVALVVSYMLKDRIKELMRYYFAHQLGAKYFDNKTTICLKDKPIGWSKEGVDFITDSKVPPEIMKIRDRTPLLEAENQMMAEKILLYRKLVHIDREEINKNSNYPISGINDIMRLHLVRFMQKMDNPEEFLYLLNENDPVSTIQGEKVYYLNTIMQLKFEDQVDYKHFRVIITQSGITGLEELK